MDWAVLAILHSAAQGWISILDKYNVSRLVRDVRTYYLLMGTLSIVVGIVVAIAAPLPVGVSWAPMAKGALGSLTLGGSLMLMFLVYRTHEVSRVVPVTQSYPIFVAIIATLFLGETLNFIHWGAILVTMAGVLLISFQRIPGKGGIPLGRPFVLMTLASLGIAVFNIMSKSALADISIWNMYTINNLGVGLAFLAMSLRRSVVQEALTVARRPISLALIAAVLGVNFVGTTLLFSAFEIGPVSLISTIAGTRPVFVFAYTVLLSLIVPRFLREPLTPRVLALKSMSIALIVGGGSALVLA
jgi:drug/metabolite transporter (DMT)-like permease